MSENKDEFIVISTRHGDFKTCKVTPNYTRRKKWSPADPKEVLSGMPGTVVEFKVAVGDKVEVGDVLLVFKAMKMNNLMKSSISGTVKELSVELGKNVTKGTILLKFE
ncbi:MAG: biotin/lipoyl-containing protein [Rikenellaceae bacterium]